MKLTIMKRTIGLTSGAVIAILAAGAPAFAASTETAAYSAGISRYQDVLTSSSQLAADQAQSPSVKAFARGEIGTGDSLALVEGAPTSDTPVAVAANMTGDALSADGLQTHRSATTDTVADPSLYAAPLGAGVQFPAGYWSIGYLSGTSGKSFDWTYKAVQEDALTSLVGYYSAYSVSGDDLGLRATAIGELAKTKARLEALRAL